MTDKKGAGSRPTARVRGAHYVVHHAVTARRLFLAMRLPDMTTGQRQSR